MAEPVVEAPTNGVSEENGEAKKPVGEQRVRAKFLISQAAAGSVIGKGGKYLIYLSQKIFSQHKAVNTPY